jgi:transaldolase
VAPFTVNTMPEATLSTLAADAEIGSLQSVDGGDCEAEIASFVRAGVDVDALGFELQRKGAAAFASSWRALLQVIDRKAAAAAGTRP